MHLIGKPLLLTSHIKSRYKRAYYKLAISIFREDKKEERRVASYIFVTNYNTEFKMMIDGAKSELCIVCL